MCGSSWAYLVMESFHIYVHVVQKVIWLVKWQNTPKDCLGCRKMAASVHFPLWPQRNIVRHFSFPVNKVIVPAPKTQWETGHWTVSEIKENTETKEASFSWLKMKHRFHTGSAPTTCTEPLSCLHLLRVKFPRTGDGAVTLLATATLASVLYKEVLRR